MTTKELFPGSALDAELTRIQAELRVIERRVEPKASYFPGWLVGIAVYGAIAFLVATIVTGLVDGW